VTTVGFASSSEMSAHASAMREEAAVVDAKEFPTLEARLGQLLIARNVTDPELTRRCGAIDVKTALTAVHFRQLVRGLLSDPGLTPVDVITSVGDDGPMDVLHKKLDIDSGGKLEIPEIQIAFAKIKGETRRAKYVDAAVKIAALRQAGELFDAAAAATAATEVAEAELNGMRNGTVRSRLGDLLKAKAVKVQDLRNTWDKDGNGKLDLKELSKNLDDLGFERSEDETKELFGQLDIDKSGTLASKELAEAMQQLLNDAKNKAQLERDLVNREDMARMAAEAAQQAASAAADSLPP